MTELLQEIMFQKKDKKGRCQLFLVNITHKKTAARQRFFIDLA